MRVFKEKRLYTFIKNLFKNIFLKLQPLLPYFCIGNPIESKNSPCEFVF